MLMSGGSLVLCLSGSSLCISWHHHTTLCSNSPPRLIQTLYSQVPMEIVTSSTHIKLLVMISKDLLKINQVWRTNCVKPCELWSLVDTPYKLDTIFACEHTIARYFCNGD